MAQIHYFPRYSQQENFQTNNTLLLLYQLYNFNRFRFEKFLSALLSDANVETGNAFELGLQIKQQVGTGASVPDGYLYQENIKIAIEAKRSGQKFHCRSIATPSDRLYAIDRWLPNIAQSGDCPNPD